MERRSNPRKYLRRQITLEIPSSRKPIGATMLDISLGGAFIEVDSVLRVSTILMIEFRLPDSRPQNTFRLFAKVVRRTRAGLGVAFLKMPMGTLHALNEALWQLPRPASEDSDREPTQGFAAVWVV